jgi:hypothetical protein
MARSKEKIAAAPIAVESVQVTRRYLSDREMAPLIGSTASFLQKDRLQPVPLIPFLRIGDKVMYHPPTVFATLEAQQKGRRS